MDEVSLTNILLHEKPVKMLLGIRNNGGASYTTKIAKYADCTYSHTMKIIDIFENKGLVESEKKGRTRYIKLTKVGEEIANLLDELMRLFKKVDGIK